MDRRLFLAGATPATLAASAPMEAPERFARIVAASIETVTPAPP